MDEAENTEPGDYNNGQKQLFIIDCFSGSGLKFETMTDYQLDILNNIETRLLEYLANFLDDEDQVLDEKLADIEHRDYRSDCELHIKMAKAALEVYKQNVDFNSPR